MCSGCNVWLLDERCDHLSSRARGVCDHKLAELKQDLETNFVRSFRVVQMSKRSCKKIFDHYNAIPSLSGDCHYKFWISDLFIDFVRKACSHSYWFLQLPGSPLRSWTQVKLWGTTANRVVQGNLGDRPSGAPSPNNQLKANLQSGEFVWPD